MKEVEGTFLSIGKFVIILINPDTIQSSVDLSS